MPKTKEPTTTEETPEMDTATKRTRAESRSASEMMADTQRRIAYHEQALVALRDRAQHLQDRLDGKVPLRAGRPVSEQTLALLAHYEGLSEDELKAKRRDAMRVVNALGRVLKGNDSND